jgi:hypothetical protein
MIKIGDYVKVIRAFRVFRELGDGQYDICDAHGNCLTIRENEIYLLNKTTTMKAMKQAVLTTAKTLLKANNTVTTLEIKTELRRDYPYYYWDQSTVSNYMIQLSGDGLFDYVDNGTFRIYSLPKKKTVTTRVDPSTIQTTNSKRVGSISVGTTPALSIGKQPRNKTVGRSNLLSYVTKNQPIITGVILVSGRNMSIQEIKNQKKSVSGYIKDRISNLKGIEVNGFLVTVK